MDPLRAWCPMPGCETVVSLSVSKFEGPQCATCPTCTTVFCAACSESYHPSQPCHADELENMVRVAPRVLSWLLYSSSFLASYPVWVSSSSLRHLYSWY